MKRILLDINAYTAFLTGDVMETGSVIVSFDAHFDQVSGLRRWTQ